MKIPARKYNEEAMYQPKQTAQPTTNSDEGAAHPVIQSAQRYVFNVDEFIVYPAHGVGQILAIEQQEIAGAKLELFVICFMKDKMTLRVPTKKVANVGMRKLSDPATIQRVHQTLGQPRHVAVGHWFRLAQEYEAKINSGDIIAIAEVMRDLYRPAVNPGQSYSERKLYETALDRLAEEVAFVQQISKEQAITELENLVIAGAGRRV
jgi:CarD family transcriptional regulator